MARISSIRASSSNADNSEEVQEYPYPAHVNTANFVSIKLSGKTNYRSWQEQMMCLLDSHDMRGFIDGTTRWNWKIRNAEYREWKRSDTLVKGWIFGSLTEDVMDTVVGLHTSHQVWKQLKKNYDILAAPTTTTNTVSNQDSSKYRPLYGAVVNGHWENARKYFIEDKKALTVKINDDDDSPLHVAIGTCQNIDFVENLLKEIHSDLLPTLKSKRQQNPLHRAALVGNTKAAEMLVKKNPNLLFITDQQGLLPIHRAIFGAHVNTFKHLLEVTKTHIGLSQQQGRDNNPFKGSNVAALLTSIISNDLFGDAYKLIKEYPDMARTIEDFSIPLKSIAGKLDADLSGTKYNFYQKFVYHYVPIKDHKLDNANEIDQDIKNEVPDTTTPIADDVPIQDHKLDNAHEIDKDIESQVPDTNTPIADDVLIEDHKLDNAHEIDQDIENQVLDTTKPIAKGRISSFYSVIRRIYVKLWIVLLHVAHVKDLHDVKVKHNTALLLLKCICEELQQIKEETELQKHYHKAVLFALEHDATEAIKEIIKWFPQAICTKQNDLNLIQLSIVNRCENVYSFLVHKAVIEKHVHKTSTDKDGNNILHLAGKLAPIEKLNMVSGAALQMQRELQWFQEVKKFAHAKHIKTKNNKQETPIMVFRSEHQELRKEGEEWMKKTAESYTITAALIITIVFAAAITVPGGSDDNTGKPIYTTNPGFIIFVVSDAISLFTSSTSLLLCLSILTTRYRYEDFLYRLPKKLILSLSMLFISVTSMMIAFSSTLYIMYAQEKAWILYPIAAFTCLPIMSFVTLQLPLLCALCSSTYGQGIFGKQNDMEAQVWKSRLLGLWRSMTSHTKMIVSWVTGLCFKRATSQNQD